MSCTFEPDKTHKIEFDVVEAADLVVGDVIFHDNYCSFYDLREISESTYSPGELILHMVLRPEWLHTNAPAAVTMMFLPVAELHRVRSC